MKQMKQGSLFVISAASGTGKTTLCHKLCEILSSVSLSVSYTTRSPRDGEINDVHYTFVDEDEFRKMIDEGDFVEWAHVHGNFYGTSKKRLEGMIKSGVDVLLDIDVQGSRQIREYYAESVLIFVFPPSMFELKKRLVGRMSESEGAIEKRLKKAREEFYEYKKYDYVILNDCVDDAMKVLSSIITAERLRVSKADHEWIEETFLREE